MIVVQKVNPSQTHNSGAGWGGASDSSACAPVQRLAIQGSYFFQCFELPCADVSHSQVVITDDVSLKVFMEHLIRPPLHSSCSLQSDVFSTIPSSNILLLTATDFL